MEPSPRSASSPLAAGAASPTGAAFSSRGCCCFWVSRSSVIWERIRTTDDQTRPESATAGSRPRKWWKAGVGALMKVREWSEIVAGPRWKTFIRRFNRSTRHGGGGGGGCGGGGGRRFGYDPLSYSLNFDGGNGGISPERDFGYPDFSARFVAPPASASSMDLSGRDAPVLFAAPPTVVAAAAAAAVH